MASCPLAVDDILEDRALILWLHPRPNKLCLVAGKGFDWGRGGNESDFKLEYEYRTVSLL
jgi:hypothetical protein